MIMLNGVALSAAVPLAKIIDIIVGAPALEVVTLPKTLLAGDRFVRRRYGSRPVRILLDLSDASATEREAARNALTAWCDHTEPVWLQLDTVPGKHLVVTCVELPDYSIANWWEDLEISLQAIDPYFIKNSPSTASIGSAFTVGGNGPAIGVIEQTTGATITAPTWTLDAGPAVRLLGSIAAGVLKIDLEARRVDRNATPIMGQVALNTRFFDLLPGPHTIAGGNGAGGTISWFERWL